MEWMQTRKINYSFTDYALHLDLLSKTKGIAAADKYFNDLEPAAQNMLTYGALLNCYCQQLMEDKALSLFKKMDQLDYTSTPLAFNNLMTLYKKMGKPEKVLSLVQEMKERRIPLDLFTYNIWMQSYADMNDIEGAERVLDEMADNNKLDGNWTTYNNLASIYIKVGQFEKAELALKWSEQNMRPRKREAFHFLISLYAGTSNVGEVYRVWNALKLTFPNTYNSSYLVMLQALRKLNDIHGLKKCYDEWVSCCSYYDLRLANVVIDGYLKNDMYQDAALVFDEATKRSKGPFFNAHEMFMVFFLKERRVDLAWRHVEAAVSGMRDNAWSPTPAVAHAFLEYFENERDVDGAEQFCKILQKLNSLNSDAFHLLLKTYVASGKTSAEILQRLEKNRITISSEFKKLLERICPVEQL